MIYLLINVFDLVFNVVLWLCGRDLREKTQLTDMQFASQNALDKNAAQRRRKPLPETS